MDCNYRDGLLATTSTTVIDETILLKSEPTGENLSGSAKCQQDASANSKLFKSQLHYQLTPVCFGPLVQKPLTDTYCKDCLLDPHSECRYAQNPEEEQAVKPEKEHAKNFGE